MPSSEIRLFFRSRDLRLMLLKCSMGIFCILVSDRFRSSYATGLFAPQSLSYIKLCRVFLPCTIDYLIFYYLDDDVYDNYQTLTFNPLLVNLELSFDGLVVLILLLAFVILLILLLLITELALLLDQAVVATVFDSLNSMESSSNSSMKSSSSAV